MSLASGKGWIPPTRKQEIAMTSKRASWKPMETAPKDKPILLLLEECAGTYPVLAQWKDDPRGFCWHVPGSQDQSGWHTKCAKGWSKVRIPSFR